MSSSQRNQKQTHISSTVSRSATRTFRPFIHLTSSPAKRYTIIAIGMAAGLGLPPLVLASQLETQRPVTMPQVEKIQDTQTSSKPEEVFSSPEMDVKVDVQSSPNEPTASSLSINGEDIPLGDGSTSTEYETEDGNRVTIDVTVDSEQYSTSDNNTDSNTDISINSYSSVDISSGNETRGSPRD